MENLFKLFEECSSVTTDSRKVEKGQLYIALKGDNFDGNKFANDAIKKGAKYAIVDNQEYADEQKIFCVADGLLFLQQLANHHRNKFDIPVIGITGSNGKTTTKELIASVLSQKYAVLFTAGNLNNHIGVPLTLLKLRKEHEIAIIEMGASKPGDIDELCQIAAPDFGLITNIGKAHLEGFGSAAGVLHTKTELYRFIEKRDGLLFFNSDDEVLLKAIPASCNKVAYGTTANGQIRGTLVNLLPEVELKWSSEKYESPVLQTKILGKYNFYNMLAAICLGDYFKVQPENINKGITEYAPKNNRSQLEKTEHNTVILDAYNANPTSTKAALESFAAVSHKNKFFVLGDMLELGEVSKEEHRGILELVKSLGLQGIFIGSFYAELKNEYGQFMFFEKRDEAAQFLGTATPKNNLILLKGSRGIGLEKLMEIV